MKLTVYAVVFKSGNFILRLDETDAQMLFALQCNNPQDPAIRIATLQEYSSTIDV